MADSTTQPPARPHLAAVSPGSVSPAPVSPDSAPPAPVSPGPATRAPALPAEQAPQPQDAPHLLAALDAGDEEAVRAWFRASTPEPASLLVYGLYLGAGIAGLLEWPAVTLAVIGQIIVDRRFGGVEALAAELRAKIAGPPPAEA